jgi:hypothetical protein
MKAKHSFNFPDSFSVKSELTFESDWDSHAVSSLIRSKCSFGEMPSFLFLGRKEAKLLQQHLAAAFGADNVPTVHESYYMGLKVVELDVDSFVRAAGRKTTRVLQDPIARRPAWKDRDTESLWQFRLD